MEQPLRLDPFEPLVGLRGQFDSYGVTWAYNAPLQHDAHNSGLAPQVADVVAIELSVQEARLEIVDLLTRLPGRSK